jgi:hypothetical protein
MHAAYVPNMSDKLSSFFFVFFPSGVSTGRMTPADYTPAFWVGREAGVSSACITQVDALC